MEVGEERNYRQGGEQRVGQRERDKKDNTQENKKAWKKEEDERLGQFRTLSQT